jgi:GNAT superfamily N-acetyltransferase
MVALDDASGEVRRHKETAVIRPYIDTDWNQVALVYDLAKPDEMKGLVDANDITPLAQDGEMLRYFFHSAIWVYEEDERVLGFVGRDKDIVSWLFVHPEHRRRGIARNLMHALIESRHDPLELNLVEANYAARTLYECLGFRVFDAFEGNMYGRQIPAVRMILLQETKDE